MRFLIFVLFLASVDTHAGDKLFVVNSLDESLGWIDLETGESNQQAATLGFIPNDVVAFENALCVVNSGDNNIQVIDPVTMQTVRQIELDDAVNPFAATKVSGTKIAVSASLSGTVSIVDWSAGVVDTTFYVGTSPQFVDVAWGKLYVLCTGVEFPVFGNGVLKRYDLVTYELIDSLVVGVNPQSMFAAWFEVHVLCTGNYDDVEGSVVVIDVEGGLSIDTVLNVGGSPVSMVSGSAPGIGSGWIAAGGWGSEGYLYQYDAVEHEILHGSSNPLLTGVGAIDIVAQDYDGGSFFVSCFNQNTVEIRSCWGDLSETYEMSAGPSASALWEEPTASTPENPRLVPTDAALVSAYPNPFNGATTLELVLPMMRGEVVDLFDALGRKVAEVPVSPGQDRVIWAPGAFGNSEVSTGVYFARLRHAPGGNPLKVVYLK
ncbi:MAG: hypothetical protein H6508_04375 [Calditrichaeota bacterium]|nr:hypothetical protein [Calditrichota bacterium]MCB9366403.1 hypothetical protein [Calditrichota bacterium]